MSGRIFLVSLLLASTGFAQVPRQQPRPLDRVQVLALLAAGYTTERMTMLVNKRSIDFEPADDYLKTLQGAGVEEALLQALRAASHAKTAEGASNDTAKQTQIQQHLARAATLAKQKLYSEAGQECRTALELDPENAFLHFPLTQVLQEQENVDGAIAEAREAVRLLPDEPLTHMFLGSALASKADWKGAEEAYRAAVDLGANDFRLRLALGSCLLARGSFDRAIEEFEHSVRLQPDSADTHFGLAQALSQISYNTKTLRGLKEKSEYERAIEEYRTAIRLRPDWAEPHAGLSSLFDRSRGKSKLAAAESREAYRLDSTNPTYRMYADKLTWGEGIENRWSWTEDENTPEEYEKFIRKYPQSLLAGEAKERTSNPVYAFLVTCQIATGKAVKGFIQSHPESQYIPILQSYAEFLDAVKGDKIKSCKQFISSRPDNPFVIAAKVWFPMLWLKEAGGKVGVMINVGHLEFKGLLMGRTGTADTVRPKIWQTLEKQFKGEGVQAILLENLEQAKADKEVAHLVVMDYSQAPKELTYDPHKGGFFIQAAAENLTNIFVTSLDERVRFTVTRAGESTPVYKDISSLLSHASAPFDKAEFLKAFSGKQTGLVSFIVTLREKNLLDPKQRQAEEEYVRGWKGN